MKSVEQDFPYYIDVVVPEGALGMTVLSENYIRTYR
jgi:hypothetical protein